MSSGSEPLRASLPVVGPYSLVDSLRLQRFGRADPTASVERTSAQERYAKCSRTPLGPATLVAWMERRTAATVEGGEDDEGGGVRARVEVALYGEGREWLLPRLRTVLGLDDVPAVPSHPRLAPLRLVFARTRLVHAMSLPELHAILTLQQRVTFAEAARSWSRVVAAVGERAPGPLPLWTPPGPEHWLAMRQPQARALGIDAQRWRALLVASRAADEVQSQSADPVTLVRFVARLPGTGPWTTGLLSGLGAADADAVVLGDVHLPHDLSAFFTDVPVGSDARMLELLEPFRPNRFRVVRVLMGHGRRRL